MCSTTSFHRPVLVCIGLALSTIALCDAHAQADARNPLGLSPQHVTLSVADIDNEVAWYVRVLGLRKLERSEDRAELKLRELAIPGFRIDLLWENGSVKLSVPKGTPSRGWQHVVFKTADVEGARRALLKAGTDVQEFSTRTSDAKRLIVHDPEGNEIEILDARLDDTQ